MIDLWARLHGMFDADMGDQLLEFHIVGLESEGAEAVLKQILYSGREMRISIMDFMTGQPVQFTRPDQVIETLSSGAGSGTIWLEPVWFGIKLPMMGFSVEEPEFMMIHYPPGPHWSPVQAMVMFDFFRYVKSVEQQATIQLSKLHFDKGWLRLFETTLREYLNERYKP